jgi:hypothetical protein
MILFTNNSNSPAFLTAAKKGTESKSNSPAAEEPTAGTASTTTDEKTADLEGQDGLCGDLLKEAAELPPTIIERPTKTISREAFDALIRDISSTYKCSPPAALVGLFSTLKAGGTNKNQRSNVKITVAGCSFESKKVNELITKHCKEFTPRQFAVYFRNDIFKLSKIYDIMGNAYVSLRRNYSDVITDTNQDEKYWASDFQIDNPACLPLIRQGLQKRYNDKFTTRRK